MKLDPKKVKSFIKSYHRLRDKINEEDRGGEGWDAVLDGRLSRAGSAPEEWKKYNELKESDFPDCIPVVRSILRCSCFTYWKWHFCFDRTIRAAAKRLRKTLDLLVKEIPAWDKVVSFKVRVWEAKFYTYLTVVTESGAQQEEVFSHNWTDWGKPDQDQHKESAKKFFASRKAQEVLAAAKKELKANTERDIRDRLGEIVLEAMGKGFEREHLLLMVDEAITKEVMAA